MRGLVIGLGIVGAIFAGAMFLIRAGSRGPRRLGWNDEQERQPDAWGSYPDGDGDGA